MIQIGLMLGGLETAPALGTLAAEAGVEHVILTPLAYGDALRDQVRALADALLR